VGVHKAATKEEVRNKGVPSGQTPEIVSGGNRFMETVSLGRHYLGGRNEEHRWSSHDRQASGGIQHLRREGGERHM